MERLYFSALPMVMQTGSSFVTICMVRPRRATRPTILNSRCLGGADDTVMPMIPEDIHGGCGDGLELSNQRSLRTEIRTMHA